MSDGVSEQMRTFIAGFGEAVRSQDIARISSFYENGGLKFAEKSKQIEWPSVDVVSSIVSGTCKVMGSTSSTFNAIFLFWVTFFRHLPSYIWSGTVSHLSDT